MYEKLTHCPLCKSRQFDNFLVVKDHAISQESFSICKCNNCSLLFTNPRPDKAGISRYYQDEKYISHKDKGNSPINILYKAVRIHTTNQKIKWINEFSKGKHRLLDFGCGTGYFLDKAKKKGWEGIGVEPNAEAAELARKKRNLYVVEDISELAQEKKFDSITLFHVLEHVHDLEDTLHLLLSKLKKRGTLFVAVPNYNSYDSQLYGENWAPLDVPRHLYHFTAQTMEFLAKQYELKIRDIKPLLFDSYYASILSNNYIPNKKNIIKPFINGYKSNLSGKNNINNYSSLLFVMKKI